MLHIKTNDVDVKLPLSDVLSNSGITMDGETVSVRLVYTVPDALIQTLLLQTCLILTDDHPLVILELEILHCAFDFETEQSKPIGNLTQYPVAQDLADLHLSDAIAKNSTLYMPGYAQRAKLKHIRFGALTGAGLGVDIKGTSTDINGPLHFHVCQPDVPVNTP